MPGPRSDPYTVLGVGRDASDEQIRVAYRRLVQLHHPDHNGGSVESARRFEAVQEAYSEVRRLRASSPGSASPPRASSGAGATASHRPTQPPRAAADPEMESRLADLERQVREAHETREQARRAAAAAAAAARTAAARTEDRPSDEELGYVTTDDSFSKLLADARDEVASWLDDRKTEGQGHPAAKRVSDLIDSLAEKLPNNQKSRGGSGPDGDGGK